MNHKTKKRAKAIILAVAMTFSTVAIYSFGAEDGGFTDTNGHWAEEYIDRWTSDGVIFGFGDGTFQPDSNVTRAEFSSILNQIYTYSRIVPNTFDDICDSDWHSEIFQRLVAAGVVIPDVNNMIHPDTALSRGELFAMTARAFEIPPVPGSTTFSDNASIEDSLRPYVRALQDAGLITGYEERDGFEIRADRLLTRAEMLVVLDRADTVRMERLEDSPIHTPIPTPARVNTNPHSFRDSLIPSPVQLPIPTSTPTLPHNSTLPPWHSINTPTPTQTPFHTPTPMQFDPSFTSTPTPTLFSPSFTSTPTPTLLSPSFTSTPTPMLLNPTFAPTPTLMPQNPTFTPTPFTPSPTVVNVIPPAQAPSRPDSINATEFELEVLRLVNIERANHGLRPLEWDARAATAARNHSIDMATRGFFSHICPSGRGPRDRLRAAGHSIGVTYMSSSENISTGRATPEIAVTQFMRSNSHRASILGREYTHLGVGFHELRWTQLFLSIR